MKKYWTTGLTETEIKRVKSYIGVNVNNMPIEGPLQIEEWDHWIPVLRTDGAVDYVCNILKRKFSVA